MKPHRLHIGFWFMIVLPLLCRAQDASYIQYTTEDGLPTDYVYGVVEDADGYIWAYTENGLAKFDGYQFEHFTVEDGLPGNDIPFAEKGPDGKIWLQSLYNRPAYLYQDSIYTIHDEGCIYMGLFDGEAHFGCKTGVYAYQDSFARIMHLEYDETLVKAYPEYFEPIASPEQMDSTFFYQYVYTQDREGMRQWYQSSTLRKIPGRPYYISSDPAAFFTQKPGGQWQELELEPGFDSDNFNFGQIPGKEQYLIKDIKSNMCWVDPVALSYRFISPMDYGIHPKAHLSIAMQHDRLWMSTDAGALCFDFEGNLLEKVQNQTLAERYFLHRTYSDSRGNIWIGSRDGGLFLIPQANKRVHKRQLPQEADQHFEELIYTENGRLIGITANTGVYHITKDTIVQLVEPRKSRRLLSTAPTPHGLYISASSYSLLLQEHNRSFRTVSVQDYFYLVDQDSSYSHYLNGGGRQLSYHAGENTIYNLRSGALSSLSFMPPGRKVRVSNLDVLCPSLQRVYYHPNEDQLYVSGVKGIEAYADSTYVPLLPKGKHIEGVSTLFGTPGKLWIGTEHNGLYCYDLPSKQLEFIAKAKMIRKIRSDGERGVLVACNEGVLAVPFEHSQEYTHYTIRHGLPTNEIEDVLAHGDSTLYIASTQGIHELNRFFKTEMEASFGLLQLKGVNVKGQALPVSRLTELSHRQSDLSFHYSLRSYASNGNIRYYTRLEPLEAEWEESRERRKSYLELSPGDYTFHLKAKDIYGNEVQHEPVVIHIAKAFWQEWWFRALCLLSFVSVIALLALQRVRRERRKQETKRSLEKRIANLELDALKAQMNPHFIFNALGAIQYFIQTQDVDSADNYLTMFARLMRKYLDSAREKMISLEQEIALLRDYTALEKMRFEELFEVELELKESLDPSEYVIPSMLLQPFVENAINHGLSERRDKRGFIRIQFEAQGNTLICRIEDNGIGREQAGRNRRKGHRSRGMKIVREKMDTLRTSGIADIRIEVQEAFPENAEYPGTLVTIRTKPLENE
jgi:hypothetical protein